MAASSSGLSVQSMSDQPQQCLLFNWTPQGTFSFLWVVCKSETSVGDLIKPSHEAPPPP